MSSMCKRGSGRGFSLVELLVVIGIIAVLLAVLTPALQKARRSAYKAACASNLKQLGITLMNYAQTNRGWLFPVGPDREVQVAPGVTENRPTTFGTNVAPHERWPAVAFGVRAPDPLPYAANLPYVDSNDPTIWRDRFNAEAFTPKVLLCPEDQEAWEYHSYVLNQHLADYRIRAGDRNFGSLRSTSEVIWAGEKKTDERDYYVENTIIAGNSEFDRVVEKYRHGIQLGSNYLYLDGSVQTLMPDRAKTGIDPWQPGGLDPSTPSSPTP